MNKNLALKIYENFYLIRNLEERISKEYLNWQMRCPTHLSVGQEMVSACINQVFSKSDSAVSSHRAHAHYVGKGGSIKKMISEIYGKETGCSKGLGGSMHLIDLKCNFMGSTAIVGNSIPVGVGHAMAHKYKKENRISLIFFGDAAIETGVFFESINLAILHKLPCIFICENNNYSVYSSFKERQNTEISIHKRIAGLGIKSIKLNTQNWKEVFKILAFAKNYVKKQKKPIFLEFLTYRKYEHVGPYLDNHLGYRPKKEILSWQINDPLKKIKNFLLIKKISNNKISLLEKKILSNIDKAFDYAKKSKLPKENNYKKYLFK
jgi:pyruvate dehydrogenase E1 component alpha subunit